MVDRRHFISGAAASFLTANAPIARSQTQDNLLDDRMDDPERAIREAIAELPKLHSIQVQVADNVVFADAPRGPGLERMANIKSCSKSLVALLLGIAIDRGEIGGIASKLGDIAPSLIPSGATEGVADLTMENLVTLQAGLERTSGGNYGEWISSANWVADVLRRPMVAEPGSRMLYSTGTTHLLGAILAEATGKSLLVQMRERLGDPLSIEIAPWTRDPQGYFLGGNQMALTPRGMLKIAAMFRDFGRFDAGQVIPSEWARQSTVPRTRSPFSGMEYGYGWFLTASGYALARGYGGQIIAAHRDRNLAIAITSDPNSPARSGGYFGELMALLDGPVLALA